MPLSISNKLPRINLKYRDGVRATEDFGGFNNDHEEQVFFAQHLLKN